MALLVCNSENASCLGGEEMNIYDFINSKAVAAYLRENNYKFSAYEMAYLIHHNKTKTLAKKISALKEILAQVPDCEVHYRKGERSCESTHELITGYVRLQEQRLETFSQSENSWFTIEGGFYFQSSGSYVRYADAAFSSFDDCLSYLRQEISEEDSEGNECAHSIPLEQRFTIAKRTIGSGNQECWIVVNRKLEILEIVPCTLNDDENDFELMLDNGHIQVPIPFNRGDIVIDSTEKNASPFVFTTLKFWDSATLKEHGTTPDGENQLKRDKRIRQRNENVAWDSSEMVAMGIERAQKYGAPHGCMIWEDVFGAANSYLDLEYYAKPLTGADRILDVLSGFEKGQLNIECVVNLTHYLLFDSMAEETSNFINLQYNESIKAFLKEDQ